MYFKYSGLNIYYEKKGTGTPIIFLHGWGCTGDIFTNITKDLYNNYEVYLIDLPAFGKSINDSVIFSINDYSNFLYSFIGELKIDNPIFFTVLGRIAFFSFIKIVAKAKSRTINKNAPKGWLCTGIVRQKR